MLSTSSVVSSQVCHYVGPGALPISQLLQLERYRGFAPGTKPPADVLQTRRNIHTARRGFGGTPKPFSESTSSGLQKDQKCSLRNDRRSFQSSAQASGLWGWISSAVSKPPEKEVPEPKYKKGRRVIEPSTSLPEHVVDAIPRLVEQYMTTYSEGKYVQMGHITYYIQEELNLKATLGERVYRDNYQRIISLITTPLNNRRKYELTNAGGKYWYRRKPNEGAPQSRVVKIPVSPDAPKLPTPKEALLKAAATGPAAKPDLAQNYNQVLLMSPQDEAIWQLRKGLGELRAYRPTGSSRTPRKGDLFAAFDYDLASERTRSLFAFNPEAHGFLLSSLKAHIPEDHLWLMTRQRLLDFCDKLVACEHGFEAVERYHMELQHHDKLYQRDVVSVLRRLESRLTKVYRQGITHDMQVHRKPRAGARATITNHMLEQSAIIVYQIRTDLGELSTTLEEKGKLIAAKFLEPIERQIREVEEQYADAEAELSAIRQRHINSIPQRLRSKKDREAEIDLQVRRLRGVRRTEKGSSSEKGSEYLRGRQHTLIDNLSESAKGMNPLLRELFDEMTEKGYISRLEADKEHIRLGTLLQFDLEKDLDRWFHKLRGHRYRRLQAEAGPEIVALRPWTPYSDMIDDIHGNIEDIRDIIRWASSLLLTKKTNAQLELRGIIQQLHVLLRDNQEMSTFARCLCSNEFVYASSASPLRTSLTLTFRPFWFFTNFWDEMHKQVHGECIFFLSIRLDLSLHRGRSSRARSRESARLDKLVKIYFSIRTSMKQIIIELEDAYWVITSECLKRRSNIEDNSNNTDLQPFLNTSYAQGRGPLWQRELNGLAIDQPKQTLGISKFQPSPRSAMYPQHSDRKFPVYLLCSPYSISKAVAELRRTEAIGVYAHTRIIKKPWDRSSERSVLDILVISTPTRAYLISPDVVLRRDGSFKGKMLDDLAELLSDTSTVKIVDNLYKTREHLDHQFTSTRSRIVLGPLSSSIPYENISLPEPSNRFPENISALVDRARAPLCWYMGEQHEHLMRYTDEASKQLPEIGPVCIDPESEFGFGTPLAHGGRQAYSRDDWLYKFSLDMTKRFEPCGELDQDARRSLAAYYMATTFGEDRETICRVAGVSNAPEIVAVAARKHGLPYHDWHKALFEDSLVPAGSTPVSAESQQHQVGGHEVHEHELHALGSLTAWSPASLDPTEHEDDLVYRPVSEIPAFTAYMSDLEEGAEYTQIDSQRDLQRGKIVVARDMAYELQTWRRNWEQGRARPLVRWSSQQERRATQATRRPSLERALRGATNKLKKTLKKQTVQEPASWTPMRALPGGDGQDGASSSVKWGPSTASAKRPELGSPPKSNRQGSKVIEGIGIKYPPTISSSRTARQAAALESTDQGARRGQGRKKSRVFTAIKIKKYASLTFRKYNSIASSKADKDSHAADQAARRGQGRKRSRMFTAIRRVEHTAIRKVDRPALSQVDKDSQAGVASTMMSSESFAARASSPVTTKSKPTPEAMSTLNISYRSVLVTGQSSADGHILPSQGPGKSGAKSTSFAAKADGQSTMKKQAKPSSLRITYQSSDPLPTAGARQPPRRLRKSAAQVERLNNPKRSGRHQSCRRKAHYFRLVKLAQLDLPEAVNL
ncbi:uncharacterized protein AB675_6049 [Cyphellophora attinorum]|uniref:Uncharacterized protein n=1 Tax=Cyphellophora attinorum TaxID=1664694 RepID=A0A0N1H4H9_9EURO|nr:uncharacterized protein AB675_6049 [Phialophora attinorum]KPI36953.1 hypothetical protein AB675_6049 [Phialophora attinorum]